jgi:hypothetical protein
MSNDELYRYANKENQFSDKYRWWTWYWDKSLITRYKNKDTQIKLWWNELFKIKNDFKKPLIIENSWPKFDLFKDITLDDNIKNLFENKLLNKPDLDLINKINNIKDDNILLQELKQILPKEKRKKWKFCNWMQTLRKP